MHDAKLFMNACRTRVALPMLIIRSIGVTACFTNSPMVCASGEVRVRK
jgi:hypothetical protein